MAVESRFAEAARPEPVKADVADRRRVVSHEPRGHLMALLGEAIGSSGQPLEPGTRAFQESRFGHDFSRVRVHTGELAARSARVIGAAAYTSGSDIVFDEGRYAPRTGRGQRLIAHELAHVVQSRVAGVVAPERIASPGERAELEAESVVQSFGGGGPIVIEAYADPAAIHRQFAGGITAAAPTQSQAELVVESFLNRMWEAQSKREKPFRITAGVQEGLKQIFPFGVPNLRYTIHPTTAPVLDLLKPSLPETVNQFAIPVLDQLVAKEKPLPDASTTSGEPAEPKFPTPAPEFKAPPDPRKEPEKGKGEEEAMQEALKAAFEEFRKTKIGKELEESVKSYVFSKEGIPLVILVVGGVLTFVAANDPKLPSVPEIPLGEGIKLKFEYSGRASDLPPFLRQLVRGESDASGKDEKKIGVSVTVTFEEVGNLAKSVGRFFAKAARWIGNGLIKIGTVIGRAVSSIKRELLAMAGGAALGALIGGIAGGPVGAGIGALIGAGVGLIGSLIGRAFGR